MIIDMKCTDIHTHGIGGYDTRAADLKDILKIAEGHGACGVSEIVLSIYPAGIEIMREQMDIVRRAIEKQPATLKTHHAPPAAIIGIHLEGPFLNPKKCGALSADSFCEPTEYNFEKLIDGFEDIVRTITVAPEMDGAPDLIRKMTDRGLIVSMGHSDATYAEAEAGFQAGAGCITHLFNAMRGFHHREPGLAGFGLLNRNIYVEVIADPFHLGRKTIELIFRLKDPGRIIIVSDTVKESKTGSDREAITTAHKRLAGGSMPITESSERLVGMGYAEDVVKRCIAENPERFLNP